MTTTLAPSTPGTRLRRPVGRARLRLPTEPCGAVLRAVRLGGPLARDEIARDTGLSRATANRQVAALLRADLLVERPDLAEPGAVGRPRLPVQLATEHFATVGVHVGARSTAVAVHDLRGEVLVGASTATPDPAGIEPVVAEVARVAERLLARLPRRVPLWAGVAIGGRVDQRGRVQHHRLGWRDEPVGELLGARLELPVSVAPHVEAMAAAELLLSADGAEAGGSALYFYAREVVGVSLTVSGAVHTPQTGPGSIGHLPCGPTVLLDPDRTGRLEDAVGDSGLLRAARAAGLAVRSCAQLHALARDGEPTALELVGERARVLGRAVGLLGDVVNPDHVVLGGQAFTDFPDVLGEVSRSARESSAAPERELRVTAAGDRVQQQAAAAVSLDELHADPLGALRRAGARSSRAPARSVHAE